MSSRPRRPARLLAVPVLLALLVGTALTAPDDSAAAARATDERYPVPASGSMSVAGHGYGHGHGMSQYGAQGAAKQGLTARQILSFYYPGTSLGSFTGAVRVLITRDTDNNLTVLPRSGLRVRDLGSGKTYALKARRGLTRWRLRAVKGRTALAYVKGRRTIALRPGGRAHFRGDAEFYAPGPITLVNPWGRRVYRGHLRLASPRKGSVARDTVNVLSMDDYVRGVVPTEMPASWRAAAVQAQSVAARTYATWSRAQYPSRYYQICDTTWCQVYGGLSAEDSRSNAAVTATRGQILLYRGAPAFTQFASSSGGWTAAGGKPYLVAKADPYDGFSGNPVHSWTRSVNVRPLEKAYPRLGKLLAIRVTARDGNGDLSGRVSQLVLDGSKSDVGITGDSFRSRFGLRSTWFTFK